MIRYYCGATVFAILMLLFTVSLGWCSAPQENQGVLSDSKIKKNSFKKEIIKRIKKSLPKDLRQCSIVVTDIKLLRADDEFNLAEEWTVNVCQEKIIYYVRMYDWPKGYDYSVKPREERIIQEKQALKSTKDWLYDDENYRKQFFYLEEILTDEELRKIRGQGEERDGV